MSKDSDAQLKKIDRLVKKQAAYRKLFLSNDLGKEILKDIVQFSGLMSSPHRRGSTEDTFIKIGEANVGRMVMDMLKMKSFDGLLELEDEHAITYENLYGEEEFDV